MIHTVIMMSGVLAIVCMFVIWVITSAMYLIYESEISVKDFINGQIFVKLYISMRQCFNIRYALIMLIAFTLLFIIPVIAVYDQVEARKRGECTCECAACKLTRDKVNAVVEYLNLDEGDIADLLKNAQMKDE